MDRAPRPPGPFRRGWRRWRAGGLRSWVGSGLALVLLGALAALYWFVAARQGWWGVGGTATEDGGWLLQAGVVTVGVGLLVVVLALVVAALVALLLALQGHDRGPHDRG